MRVGIVGQKGNERAASLAARLCASLLDDDASVAIDEATAATLESRADAGVDGASGPVYETVHVDEMAGTDLVVSIGGDGTFLYAARGAGTTPIMGVNLGEVGFLNAVDPQRAVDVVTTEAARLAAGEDVCTREMPRVRARTDDWELPAALNEVVVQGPQRGHGNGATVDVAVDEQEYDAGHADGVLVATPTGSTAYNLSEGGPLVHPAVDSLIVTGMCSTDGMPPLVVDDDVMVTVRVTDAASAVVVSDGRRRRETATPATVTISLDDDPVRIAGPPLDFFTALGKLE
ncbi:MAG: NAD(+)/NADH kinase [Haloarculaceae archaeon]